MAKCKFLSCDKESKNSGFCWGHYTRKRLGKKMEGEIRVHKHQANSTFFDIIDKPIKSYILGLLITDGCLETDKRNGLENISFLSMDKYLVEIIRNSLSQEMPIHSKNNNKYHSVTIRDKHIRKNIIKDRTIFRLKYGGTRCLENKRISL
jgi:hypothetical protein